MEEVRMESSKKKGKGSIIIIAVLLFVCIGLVGFIYVNRDKLVTQQEEKMERQKEEKQNLEITDNVKGVLEEFINLAYSTQTDLLSVTRDLSKFSMYSPSIMEEFYSGNLSKTFKLEMTYNQCKKNGKVVNNVRLYEDEINQMIGEKLEKAADGIPENVGILFIDEFNDTYEKLFQEKPEYTLDEIKNIGCPLPWGINYDKGRIYLFYRCGGTTGLLTYTCNENKTYDSDRDYYYVHKQINCSDVDGSSDEHKSVWQFDKNLKFIKATQE